MDNRRFNRQPGEWVSGGLIRQIVFVLLVVLIPAADMAAGDVVSDSTKKTNKLSLRWGAQPDSGDQADDLRSDIPLPKHLQMRLVSQSTIPPITARPGFDSIKTFSYLLLADSAQTATSTGPNAPPQVRGITSVPVSQRITPARISSPADSGVITLVANWKIKNPAAAINRRDIAPYQKWLSLVRIDPATGKILLMTQVDLAHPKVIDTLAAEYWDFSRTLWHFYGRWMLYLSDDFSFECVRQSALAGAIRTTMSVQGREIIDGRDCFVVEIRRETPFRPSAAQTYWVDAEERVTQQLKIGSTLFKRVKPGRAAQDKSPSSP